MDKINQRSEKLTAAICSAISEALRVPPDAISADLALGDLPQWDSMGHMEVMMVLEQNFGIEINNDTIADLTSIAAILQYIGERDRENRRPLETADA